MSLYSALFSGVSGLNAFSSAMGAISDNITNVNTVGYKGTNMEFSTLVTESRSANSYSAGGVQANVRNLISRQGLLQASTSNTDLSIDGAGFFVVRGDATDGNSEVRFTRAGSFRPDSEGYLQNTSGQYLLGFPLESDGTYTNTGDVRDLQPITITGLTGTAEPTTRIRLQANLQSDQVANPQQATYDPATNNMASGAVDPDFQTLVTVFDAQGGKHSINISFIKSATPNLWSVELYGTDNTPLGGLVNGQIATGQIAFNSDGSIDTTNTSASLLAPLQIQWQNGSADSSINFELGTNGELNGITQFGSASAVRSTAVDGAVFGNITGVAMDKEGYVTALFDNGLTRRVYRLPLANFQNPDGLVRLQGNSYGLSNDSGTFALVDAGTGGSGTLAPSTLEASTVDLAAEFTKLITTQRAFSASTRVITTADEMLNELNQIKR
jgi:flagellar hook protein FlgE